MRLSLHASALADLDGIHDWIARENPPAAADMVSRIRDHISLLEIEGLAHMGRPGMVAGTRELIEHPYIIVYTVDDKRGEIVVIAILHGAQNRRP